jgi:branched-chain amino acid transport system substrate-binding protein
MDRKKSGKISVSRREMLEIAGVSSAIGLAGCTGGGDDGGDTFKIGILQPLSGDSAEMGSRFQDVVGAGVTAVNDGAPELAPLAGAEGEGIQGQDGAEVEVLWSDHQGSSDVARTEAESMVQDDGVDMLTGTFFSGTTQVVSQVAQREQVPMVCGTAIGEGLTERGLDWFWQVPPHTRKKAESMFNFADDMNEQYDAGLETVAILHQDGTFGTEVAKSTEQVVEEFGYEIAPDPISYSGDSVNSLQTELRSIEDAGADIIVHSANVRDALILLDNMETEGYYPDMMLTPGSAYLDPSLLDDERSDFIFSGSDFADDMYDIHEPMGEYNSFSEEESGTPFDGSSIYAWGEFFSGVAAANEAESLSPDDLQASLNSLSLDPYEAGLPYPVEFNDQGYNEESFSFVVQAHDGEVLTVWPFDQAQDDTMTYPVPEWDER